MRISDCQFLEPTFNKTLKTDWDIDCKYIMQAKNSAYYCKRPGMYRCIDDGNRLVVPLSHSSLQTFITCHNLYYLKNIRGIETRPAYMSSALKMGVLWDTCQQYWLGDKTKDPNDVILKYEMNGRDVAKVRAVYRALKELEVKVEEGYELQKAFNKEYVVYDQIIPESFNVVVNGIYDRWHGENGYFVENKMSSRPDNYNDIWFIQSQVGTYFMVDESLKYCIMEVIRTPDLKSTGRNADEDDGVYEKRCFDDIMSRPSHYFMGWNRDTRTYGKKFYRDEFDLVGLRERYEQAARELHIANFFRTYYKNDRVCSAVLPGIPCDMLGVCRYDTVSENVYKVRDIPEEFDDFKVNVGQARNNDKKGKETKRGDEQVGFDFNWIE